MEELGNDLHKLEKWKWIDDIKSSVKVVIASALATLQIVQ